MTRSTEKHRGRLLLAADAHTPSELPPVLVAAGFEAVMTEPDRIHTHLSAHSFDAVLLWSDHIPASCGGLGSLEDRCPVPLVVMLASVDPSVEIRAHEAGAWEVLCPGARPEVLLNRLEKVLRLARHLHQQAAIIDRLTELSITDDVTGLHNQRYLRERLPEELERGRRYDHPLSVILLDVDFFKRVNDDADHLLGTLVLQELGSLLKANLRAADIPCRYGGDEFVLVLVETGLEQAVATSERLRRTVADHEFCSVDGHRVRITASFGIASYPVHRASSAEELLRLADAAMYAAKEAGRNRLMVAQPSSSLLPLGAVR